ncbi:MAG: aconitate hydratase AcnA [Planctomycetes bacterium]|nr:aconitate hydratase AcnA [Planctomycetota bacterium]
MKNSFQCRESLDAGGSKYSYYNINALGRRDPAIAAKLKKMPYAHKVLLENLLRHEDGETVTARDIETLAKVNLKSVGEYEIAFTPARVLMQDFTGVPAVVDLAAMRDAMKRMGGDPKKINPLEPVELVIDHSVQVDYFGSADAADLNAKLEFERNRERYAFLKWGQESFDNLRVVPPDTGIVHQVNLEYLARVVMSDSLQLAHFDTVVGTDSHTTMINGLGVLGWGVGGIEAEAAMLGQPSTMLIPEVIGVALSGRLREGATATDLVLRVTEMLRKHGVVGKFVEFFGPGLANLPLADRATIANMAPEYGATCGLFPVDAETLRFLAFTGRDPKLVKLVELYYRAQGLLHDAGTPDAEYTDTLSLDLASIEPSLAGPKRPQDRVALGNVKINFQEALPGILAASKKKPGATEPPSGPQSVAMDGSNFNIQHGSVVIAAITSCTNTSNPSVLIAAGLLAKKAVERGLHTKPWVKTSLAPGSKVVADYLTHAGLLDPLEKLNFHIVGYGCTTCIGNSGPLPDPISKAIDHGSLVAAAVLSGNRNFEGRVHAQVRANYLASPPLVVAYALAGRIDRDLYQEPLGNGSDGRPVFLKDIWPTQAEIAAAVARSVQSEMFKNSYANVYAGDASWRSLVVRKADTYGWDAKSTYVKHPPYFTNMPAQPPAPADIKDARVLAIFGDSITTDHISPAGNIKADSPAGKYLQSHGVAPADFNSYGARRGNHEIMMRGTFANVRIKNLMIAGVEGGVTAHHPGGEPMSIFDAAMRYRESDVPLVILAGKEYGSGSSRDWAAKGPALLGVRVVIAESYERIHRSNLVGMGVLPLEFKKGQNAQVLGLTGSEWIEIVGLAAGVACNFKNNRELTVKAKRSDGAEVVFPARVRIDTPREVDYYRHGGILQYVLRQLLKPAKS